MIESRKLLAFAPLLLMALAIPLAVPRVNAATGLVCIADPSLNPSSCPASPASFTGTVGASITVAVNIQGSDAVNGFDISTLVDPSVLQPVNISIASSIIHSPNIVVAQSVDANSGIARMALVAIGYVIPAPVSGNLFNIIYKVLSSNRGTGIVFQTGCSGTSVPNTCVTVVNPNTDSETVQNGSLIGPVTPDFTMSAPLKSQSLPAGTSTFTNILVNSLNGFSGTINLSVQPPPVCPSCPTWSITPTSVSLSSGGAASAILSFNTTVGTPQMTFNVFVNGTSSSLKHSVIVSFTVTAPVIPDFSISANPASQNVQQGTSATSQITLKSVNGFSGTVNLSVPPPPLCANCPGWSISPPSVTLAAGGTGSSTLTFTTSPPPGPTGTFNVNVTGTSGSLSHSTIASFTIVPPPPPPQVGVVCIADVSSTSCPSSPVMFQGIVGEQLQVAVNVQNSAALNGFDVQVLVNPAILQPVSTSLAGTVLPSPVFVLANSVNPTTGLVRVAAVSQGGMTVAPTTGRFFSITYNIVGATSASFILFPIGCTGTSNDSVCVTVTNPGMPGGVDPENILEANVTTVIRQDFTLSASPTSLTIVKGQSGNATINVASINGFAGTVTLSATISPALKKAPGVSITPASVMLASGGTVTASLLVSTNGGTLAGSYTVTVTATSGSITKTTTITVTIVPRH